MRTPPQKRAQQQQSPRSSRQSSISPGSRYHLTPSKRSKREREQKSAALANTQKIQAESFVMKLFDRSLDLSKYTEHTSLYPICRAWIANQPRNPSIRSYREQRSPSPVERKENAAEVLTKLRRGELREVRDMPAPEQAKDLAKLPSAFKLCGDEENLKQLDNLEAHELGVAKREELLALHMGKWKQVKSKWLKRNKIYQKRYEMNHLIIQELFKP